MNKYIFQGFVPDKKYNEYITFDNKRIQGHWVTGDLICVDVINPEQPSKRITYEIFDKTGGGSRMLLMKQFVNLQGFLINMENLFFLTILFYLQQLFWV